jgi:hypothetical protein
MGSLIFAGMGYLYGRLARGIPRLNSELERARRTPWYGFKSEEDGDRALRIVTTYAKWAIIPLVVGLACVASGVVLLLV